MPSRQTHRGRTTHTFVVRMLDTDDKGWTGVVTHVRSGRTSSFRGFIEAIRFMDACMEGDGTGSGSDRGSAPDDGGDGSRPADGMAVDELGSPAVGQGGFT